MAKYKVNKFGDSYVARVYCFKYSVFLDKNGKIDKGAKTFVQDLLNKTVCQIAVVFPDEMSCDEYIKLRDFLSANGIVFTLSLTERALKDPEMAKTFDFMFYVTDNGLKEE